MKHDPIMLFRYVLRCEDERFADLLVRILRTDPSLRERADLELHALPRLSVLRAASVPRMRAIADRFQPDGNSA